MRKDGRFTRIPSSEVELIRDAKRKNYSLRDISQVFSVAKSTVSYYCRDLFDDPQRIYLTEKEAREVITLRTVGKDHNAYHECIDCSRKIRNKHTHCLTCSLSFQKVSGERDKWITSGISTRFQVGNILGAMK